MAEFTNLADLFGMCHRERSSKDGEILTEDVGGAAVDFTMS